MTRRRSIQRRYTNGKGKTFARFFEAGAEPQDIIEDGETFTLEEQRDSDFTRVVMRETINGFRSTCLPKYWKYAPRHVQSGKHRGACVFHSRKEIREAIAKANEHGEAVVYDY